MRKMQKVYVNEHKEETGKICPYYGIIVQSGDVINCWPIEEQGTTPVVYGECPKCSRRLKLKIYIDHDGDIRRELPRHKKKGWWRKPKKQSRDNKAKRTR